jgi:hypothetical protein
VVGKDPAAVALGRKGGKAAAGKGAKQRWAKLTPEQRSEAARELAKQRWTRRNPKPTEDL